MAQGPGFFVRPPTGMCEDCKQVKELWDKRCPGNERHICVICAMTRYINGVSECPKDDCKREWSYYERYSLWELCLQNPSFSQYAGSTFRLGANEAWCYQHNGLIGKDAVAPNACPYGQCVICKRCAASGYCYCGYQSNYVPPPDCPA